MSVARHHFKPVDWELELETGLTPPSDDWILNHDAAAILCGVPNCLATLVCEMPKEMKHVRRRSRSKKGKGPRGSGWLWSRADLEAIQNIRRKSRISLRSAVKVFAAIRRGDIEAVS